LSRSVTCIRSGGKAADAFLEAHLPEGTVRGALGMLLERDVELTPAEAFREWTRGCRYELWGNAAIPDAVRVAGKEYYLAEREDQPARIGQYLAGAINHLRGNELPLPWADLAGVLYPLILLRAGRVEEFLAEMDARPRPPSTAGAWSQLDAIAELLTSRELPAPVTAAGRGLAGISPRDDDRLLDAALSGGVAEFINAAKSCWLSAWLGWRWAVRTGLARADSEALYDLARQGIGKIPYPDPRLRDEIEAGNPGAWNG
jgi:hypothetical protein